MIPTPTTPARRTAPTRPSVMDLDVGPRLDDPGAEQRCLGYRRNGLPTDEGRRQANLGPSVPMAATTAAAPEVIAEERKSGPRSQGRLLQRGTAVAASKVPV